jgi:hypothetical protein
MKDLPHLNLGFKVMYQNRRNEHLYMPVHMHYPFFEIGIEVTDTCESTICFNTDNIANSSYPAGFHIFLNLDEAIGYMISDCDKLFLVHFSDVTAWGLQQNSIDVAVAVVARRMTLIREILPEELDAAIAKSSVSTAA